MQSAAEREVVEVVAGCLRERTVTTPAGDAAVDQLRIACQAFIGTDAKPFHHAGTEALDQHVGLFDQAEELGATGWRFQVDHPLATTTAIEHRIERWLRARRGACEDRKSTRLNSSH